MESEKSSEKRFRKDPRQRRKRTKTDKTEPIAPTDSLRIEHWALILLFLHHIYSQIVKNTKRDRRAVR
jgi:hypothetical protein